MDNRTDRGVTARVGRGLIAMCVGWGSGVLIAACAMAQCPPATPGGVTVTNGLPCGHIDVDWGGVSGADWYEVWRNDTNDWNTATRLGLPTASEFSDVTALANTTYYYWVTAWHVACIPGNSRSSHSNVTTGSRSGRPAIPTGFHARFEDFPGCGYFLYWSAVPYATGYTVTMTSDCCVPEVANTTELSMHVLSPRTFTGFSVVAYNTCGVGDPTPMLAPAATLAGSNIRATDGTMCGVQVMWDMTVNRFDLMIFRDGVYIGTGQVQNVYLDTDVEPGRVYVYSVQVESICHPGTMLLGENSDTGFGMSDSTAGASQHLHLTPCQNATFTVTHTGAAATYAWFHDNVHVANGAGGASSGGGTVSGATTATLTITGPRASDRGAYSCTPHACISTYFGDASLSICLPDYNCSGGLSVQDIFDFLAGWFAADPRANYNGVNGLSVQDIFDFLAGWFGGCA